MTKKQKEPRGKSPRAKMSHEPIPFDDVMRRLLSTPPKHKKVAAKKAKKAEK